MAGSGLAPYGQRVAAKQISVGGGGGVRVSFKIISEEHKNINNDCSYMVSYIIVGDTIIR